jgi:hypothetical protein
MAATAASHYGRTGDYVRLTFKTGLDGRPLTVWARPLAQNPRTPRLRCFRVVAHDGEVGNKLAVVAAADVVRELPARMNLTYAQLEVVQ